METTILVLVLELIVCIGLIRYQIKRERYLIELNNSNEMESSRTMLEMKEDIIRLRDYKDGNTILMRKIWANIFDKNKQIKLLTQQRNGYKGKVVQLVNEWPEIDIAAVQVEPETKFTYRGVRYIASAGRCRKCVFNDVNCFEIKCKDIYFTKPE